MKRYQVLICRNCGEILIRQMDIQSTTCTSCHTQHPLKKLKSLARDVEQEAAQQIRQSAKRDQLGDLDTQSADELGFDKPIEAVLIHMVSESAPIDKSTFIGQCQLEHGMTRETIQQTLDSLSTKGLIEIDDGTITMG